MAKPDTLYHSLPAHERRQLIVQRYQVLGSQVEVARELGCSEATVSRVLQKANVPKIERTEGAEVPPLDWELIAIRRVEEVLAPLAEDQRSRVIDFMLGRYGRPAAAGVGA